MKHRILLILTILALATTLMAQVPQAFKYQAVARDSSGQLITTQQVALQIKILQGNTNGDSVYVEKHNSTTNSYGLLDIAIGNGIYVYADFDTISWANGPYFVKVEMDKNNGINYQHIGTFELLSVPYSLFSDEFSGDMKNKKISNLAYPESNNDAVTKAYVDMIFDIMETHGLYLVDFESDAQIANVSTPISFTDKSVISPSSWLWQFGDGNTSTLQNPVHSYSNSGWYTVSLTASNGILTRTQTKQNYIRILQSVQERLSNETPYEIYTSDQTLLDSLYGKSYQGGLIFYFDTISGSGLVAADSTTGWHFWGCYGTDITFGNGAVGTIIGTGNTNSEEIVHDCTTEISAAEECLDYSDGTYSDWFMPSIDELFEIYTQLHVNNIGNYSPNVYMSSTEISGIQFKMVRFNTGAKEDMYKDEAANVVAIREFN